MVKKTQLKRWYREHKKSVLIGSILIAAVIIGLTLMTSLSPFQTEGTVTFQVLDPLHADASDGEPVDVSDKTDLTIYESPVVTDMSDDEIKDLTFEDYDKVGSTAKADTVSLTITDDRFYIGMFEYGGSIYWELLGMPEEGSVITVYMLKETESINHVATADEDLSTTFAHTNKADWSITVQCDDHKGLMCGYQYDDDVYNYIVIAVTFDAVPVEGDVDVDGYSEVSHVVGNVVYCEIEGNLYNDAVYSITLSDDVIAGSPNAESIDVGFGQYNNVDYMN